MNAQGLTTKSFAACSPLLLAYSKPSLTFVTRGQTRKHCALFPWIVKYIPEEIHQLSNSFKVFLNACWSQLLMDVGLGWFNRQTPTKKLVVNTTPCVIEHTSLSRGKISTTPNIASRPFVSFAAAINGVLNGFSSFVSPEKFTAIHLNGKMTFVEGCVHLQHSDWLMTHVIQEWNNAAHVVLVIMRKKPMVSPRRCMINTTPSYQCAT